jgi:hypothetical protein
MLNSACASACSIRQGSTALGREVGRAVAMAMMMEISCRLQVDADVAVTCRLQCSHAMLMPTQVSAGVPSHIGDGGYGAYSQQFAILHSYIGGKDDESCLAHCATHVLL